MMFEIVIQSICCRLISYRNRPDWSEATMDDVKNCLTALERKLLESLDMVEVRGKRGRKVPVLIPEDCRAAMVYLAQNRQCGWISDENVYFFATQGKRYFSE